MAYNRKLKQWMFGVASATLALSVVPPALAQNRDEPVTTSEEIVVPGQITYRNRTDDAAPVLEYGLDYFQRFEPLTVGDALKRVPSVAFLSDVTESDGVRLRGPNDLVFDSTGGFWFSDLGKGNGDVMHMGHVLYARPDGSKIVRARDAMLTPNGVGLAPDERTLYVAETHTSRVWAFAIERPGVLAPATTLFGAANVLGPLPGYQLLDSLAVEASGRVCVATLVNGGITAFDPAGGTEHFAVPDPLTTNLCFGGADRQTAFITASSTGKLYKCRWPRPGLKLAFNA